MTSQITTTKAPSPARRSIRLRTLGGLDLRVDGHGEVRAVLRQPKRLALFIYLALSRPKGFHRRDTLLGLFWPDLDEEHARGALRQAVHFLRRHLGERAIVSRGDEELAPGDAVWCDAPAFEQAVAESRLDEAVALYGGDLLTGFYVADATPELDQWIESERQRLRMLAEKAVWALAANAERAGDVAAATTWARRAMSLSTQDESALRRLISLLDRIGDRAAAIQVYEEFSCRVAAEYEAEPAAETKALIEAVRRRERAGADHLSIGSPPAKASPEGDTAPAVKAETALTTIAAGTGPTARPMRRAWWARRRVALAGALAAVVLPAVGALARRVPERSSVLAVGAIRDHTGDASGNVAAVVGDLLATNVARLRQIQIVSTARLYELRAQLGDIADTGVAIARAARQAGATELLEGALYRTPAGALQLDLRRVELAHGAIRGAYQVTGSDPFAVVDSITRALAHDLDARGLRLRVADVTTTSLVAHRFYEEGLRLYYQGDAASARRLFDAAVAEDSSFGMALYYAAMCHLALSDEATAVTQLRRAARVVNRAAEREMLLIRTHLSFHQGEPAAVAIAESLATRYPTEPDGHLLVGHSLQWRGDFLASIPHFRRVIRMDSVAFRGGAIRCRACEAVGALNATYVAIDSFAAAERVVREMVDREHGQRAWLFALAGLFERQGLADSALAIFKRVSPQAVGLHGAMVFQSNLAIRTANFDEADRLLKDILRSGMADMRGGALWWLSNSLRNQGRLTEALSVARQIRRTSPRQEWFVAPGSALIEAQVLFELGRTREAAALFDSIGLGIDPTKPARTARHRTWMLTHIATSLAAAGDTTKLEQLADSMAVEGRKSLYGRDPRLHHHVRGLLWRARGRPVEAEGAFRHAIYSLTSGYTRTNYELGRLLIEQRRPREAVEMLSPALRGPLDASNLYLTHRAIHELLARAYDALGQPDSALAHYQWVARALRNSDPGFRGQRTAIRQRVALLEQLTVGH